MSASGSNSASTGVASTGSSATSTSVPAAEPAKKSNATALGVGLGVGIPVAALLGVGIFYLLRRRKRNAYAPPSEMHADEYALSPHAPSTKYAHMAETEVSSAPAAAAVAASPLMHEMSGERDKNPVELPVTEPSAPSTAGGVQAAELESPLSSPRETTTRSA